MQGIIPCPPEAVLVETGLMVLSCFSRSGLSDGTIMGSAAFKRVFHRPAGGNQRSVLVDGAGRAVGSVGLTFAARFRQGADSR